MTQETGCPGCKLAPILVIIGAINWGLVGIFQVDLVARLLGPMTTASRVVYGVIGLAGIISLVSLFKLCPSCKIEPKS